MKYIIVLGDGMADEPMESLGGCTALQAAMTPNMDALSDTSELGLAYMVPEGMAPGSDTANLSVLGYDPVQFYSGRSPLEALSIGVDLEPSDVSYRCNLVTLSEEEEVYEERYILDHSSGEISTSDAEILVDALKDGLKKEGYEFYTGTSYRHLLVWKNGKVMELTPPHDILTKQIKEFLPEDRILREMMRKSYNILNEHPLNIERAARGENKANSAWFWGAGTKPALTSFEEKTGKKGVMISAVDLLKGIAAGAGMKNLTVEGANGGLHTNYMGKAQAAIDALLYEGYDFAYIHVEAPDEMGHQGNIENKLKAIEYIDDQVVGTVRKAFAEASEDYRMLVLPDHPTPVRIRTHTKEPVPYMLYDSRCRLGGCSVYDECTAQISGLVYKDGYHLIDHLLQKK